MNFKTTLTLLLVLLILVAASWYLGLFGPGEARPTPPKQAGSAKELLISPKLETVETLRLEVKGRGHLVLQKEKDDWRIVDPIDMDAVSWKVNDVVSALKNAVVLQRGAAGTSEFEGITLDAMGLTDPAMTVTIEGVGRKLRYLIGGHVVMSENTYVKAPDSDQVCVVDVDLRSRIEKDLKAYRDTQLCSLRKDKVRELSFVSADGVRYTLHKSDDRWSLHSPVRAAGDDEVIGKALDALVQLRVDEFVADAPDQLAMYGLDAPAWTITAVAIEKVKQDKTDKGAATSPEDDKDKKKPVSSQPVEKRTAYTLLIGGPAGLNSEQVYAKRADHKWVVTIKKKDLEAFIPDTTAWREKTLVDVTAADVEKIELEQRAGTVVLVKQDGRWRLRFKDGATLAAEESAVSGLLDALTGLKAKSFEDSPSTSVQDSLAKPVCRVRLFATGRVEPIELAVGKATPSGLYRYVQRGGLAYVAAVAESDVGDLFKPALAYRDRRILSFNVDNVVAVELTREKRTYKVVRVHRDVPWTLESPVQADADQEKIKDLLFDWATTKVDRYVGEGNLKRYHLDKPEYSLVVTTEEDVKVIEAKPADAQPTTTQAGKPAEKTKKVRRQHTLLVSKDGEKVYVVSPTVPSALVGQVGPKLCDDLSAELIACDIFSDVSAGAIDRIEIKRAGATRNVYVKKAETWSYPADPVVRIDSTKIKELIGAVVDLKAKRYVSFKAGEGKHYGLRRPSVVVLSGGSQTYRIEIGRASPDGRYARSSSKGDWVFEISGADVDRLIKELKDFLKQDENSPLETD